MSVRRKVGISLCLSVVALGCAALSAPASAQAGSTASRTVKAMPQGGYVTTVNYPNGDSTSAYSSTPVTISRGATSTATVMSANDTSTGDPTGTEVAGTVTPDLSGSTVVKGKVTPPSSNVTAMEELEALGASPADVASFASFDRAAPVNNSPGPGPGAAGGHARPNAAVSPSQAYGPPLCASAYSDGRRVYMYGCDQEYKVYARGTDWYMENRYQATVISHDQAIFNPDVVTGLVFGDQYVKGNALYQWAPAATQDEGNCKTVTSTIEVKGYSLSSSSQQCPETFGPYQYGTTIFTSKWDGQGNGPTGESRAVSGASGWHNPPGVGATRSLVWRYWYV